jgi:hypothetical protein
MIELCSLGSCLRIDTRSPEWCPCWLSGDPPIYLGAESLGYLIRRLSTALVDTEGEYNGDIHGRKVSWVLSLFEAHTALYVARDRPDHILFWQDDKTAVVGTMRLQPEHRVEWHERLRSLQGKIKG